MRIKRMAVGFTAASAALALAACGGGNSGGEGGEGGDGGGQESYSVGITQIVQHPALDAAAEGFKKGMEDAGVDVEYDEQNAQGDQSNATSIAQNFASQDLDLVLAIATPTAQAAAQAISDKPIVFTAVTDPVEAQLVDSLEKPGGNVTGTTDLNPVAEQLELVKKINPDAKSVGIVYSSGEVNSEVQVQMAKEAAEEQGIEIKEATVSNSGEVSQAADSLGDVDAYYVPTDNTVVSAISTMVQAAEKNEALLIGSEAGQVEEGAAATYGIDYEALGKQTADMALKILKDGEDPAEMAVEQQSEYQLVINPEAAKRMGVEMDQEFIDSADTVVE